VIRSRSFVSVIAGRDRVEVRLVFAAELGDVHGTGPKSPSGSSDSLTHHQARSANSTARRLRRGERRIRWAPVPPGQGELPELIVDVEPERTSAAMSRLLAKAPSGPRKQPLGVSPARYRFRELPARVPAIQDALEQSRGVVRPSPQNYPK
jgi:hypothetical protein